MTLKACTHESSEEAHRVNDLLYHQVSDPGATGVKENLPFTFCVHCDALTLR